MKELWEHAILPYNLPLTILLGLVVVFWLVSLLGLFGLDVDDLDLPDDAPHGPADIGGLLMRAVNAHHVPVTIVISVFVLAMWSLSMLLNYYLNPDRSGLFAALLFIGVFVAGAFATKLLTQPLVPLMRKLKDAEDAKPVIGETGVVRSIEIDERFGQVEICERNGAPALLNARLAPGEGVLPRGTTVMVLSQEPASGLYLVRALPPAPVED